MAQVEALAQLAGDLGVGLSICYDAWFPEVTRHLAWTGAEVVLTPSETTSSDRAQVQGRGGRSRRKWVVSGGALGGNTFRMSRRRGSGLGGAVRGRVKLGVWAAIVVAWALTSPACTWWGSGLPPDALQTLTVPTEPTVSTEPKATVTGTGPAGDDAGPATALAVLEGVRVKGRAPKTGYDRTEGYGPAWSDVDRNGCDTRNDVLRRDLADVELKPGTHDCVVLAGTLQDPYTGTEIVFVKAEAGEVQIDHVVALSDSWQKGARSWPRETRVMFANDPLNLLAVDGPTNASKGDGDAATWLPPNKAFRCAYVARQTAVKAAYDLWMTKAEKAAVERVLKTCPQQRVPDRAALITTDDATSGEGTPSGEGTDRRYDSCADALAAGLGPYRRGADPEYAWYRDGDGDGVVCEGP